MLRLLSSLLPVLPIHAVSLPGTDVQRRPQPLPYPLHFQIHFATNLTTDSDGTAAGLPISGRLSYDWTQHAQRIDHGPGAYECQHFYNTDQRCSLIFHKVGMYRIIHSCHEEIPCCLDLLNIGSPSPNWASNGTYNGVVYDAVSGFDAYEWIFDNVHDAFSAQRPMHDTLSSNEYHTCREVAHGDNAGKPLTFTFPGKAKGRQDYHFDVESMIVERQDPALFELPNGCADLLCNSVVDVERYHRRQVSEY